ncbi:uncharacterized protein K444DRAFT_607690 [Hyaloscypha bicolor E]|uniref:Secreted protein n=1 Tax=Hyaloscypha bicolor E TaxID=1095630 RepID=A0A2J6TTC0_9HELO|nr:uncharacterized protein K444DRAFT_607690 [Hyaloscypha bicolor E]PMD66255.1 hypothetical protein K444DRAFT_607690 [Hyaloscypha bicolor E]
MRMRMRMWAFLFLLLISISGGKAYRCSLCLVQKRATARAFQESVEPERTKAVVRGALEGKSSRSQPRSLFGDKFWRVF